MPPVSAGAMLPPMTQLPGHHPAQQLPPGTTFLHQQQLVYLPPGFPSPPVSPTGHQLYYPGTGGNITAAQANAMIRLRGLHNGATAHDVAKFFQGYGVS